MPDTLRTKDATKLLLGEGMDGSSFDKFQFRTKRCDCFDDHYSCDYSGQ
jgi:hypothetical protein